MKLTVKVKFGRFVALIVTVAVYVPAARPLFGLIWKAVDALEFKVVFIADLSSVKLVPDSAIFRLFKAPVPVLFIVKLC